MKTILKEKKFLEQASNIWAVELDILLRYKLNGKYAYHHKDWIHFVEFPPYFTRTIMKTRLFKYIEHFTPQNRKFSDKKKSDIFHISAQNIDCATR